jgi:hypothetical protein
MFGDKEDHLVTVFKILDKYEEYSERDMLYKVVELLKDGYNLYNINVTKDGVPYIDEYGRNIQKKLEVDYF